jgi:phosphoenolpyruvate carboxykinase (GTP)
MDAYFNHWVSMGQKAGKNAPKIFGVNWFRKDAEGKYAWPGFGENARVLEWIMGRVQGTADGVETPVGTMPQYEDLNWSGLGPMTKEKFAEVTSLDFDKWKNEINSSAEFFSKFEGPMPEAFEGIQNSLLTGFMKKTSGVPTERLFEANL